MYPIRLVLVVLAVVLTIISAVSARLPLWVAVLVLALAQLVP